VVSTRRLIIAAVLCGLAILGAGTAFLVRTFANKDKLTSNVYQVGQSARLGSVSAKVVSVDVGPAVTTVIVDVSADPSASAVADLAKSFALGVASSVSKPNGTKGSASVESCSGPLAPGSNRTCSLAFDVHPVGSFFMSFAGTGGQLQWRLAA
jgi:hypothetical protein